MPVAELSCLICSARISTLNLGINACRACALFFRRCASKGMDFVCRDGSERCNVVHTEKEHCKRCRYLKCVQFAMQIKSGRNANSRTATRAIHVSTPSVQSEPSTKAVVQQELPTDLHSFNSPLGFQRPFIEGTSPTIGNLSHLGKSNLSLLHKIDQAYKIMCMVRRANELAADGSNGVFMSPDRKHVTYESLNLLNRVTAVALSPFIDHIFDDFHPLSWEEKWSLTKACQLCFLLIEGAYRSAQQNPHDPNMYIASSMSYFLLDDLKSFFVNAPNQKGHEDAYRILREQMQSSIRTILPQMRAAKLDETEFIALVGLLLSSNNGSIVFSNRVVELAERTRMRIFQELHQYYRDHRGLADYACRIGRLLTILSTFQEFDLQLAKDFEVFRLLDIFTDETFTYRIHVKDRMLR